MEIKEIRNLTGLSQADFGKKYNIPKRSIENWETGKTKCPVYVRELLEKVVVTDIEKKNYKQKLLKSLEDLKNDYINQTLKTDFKAGQYHGQVLELIYDAMLYHEEAISHQECLKLKNKYFKYQ